MRSCESIPSHRGDAEIAEKNKGEARKLSLRADFLAKIGEAAGDQCAQNLNLE